MVNLKRKVIFSLFLLVIFIFIGVLITGCGSSEKENAKKTEEATKVFTFRLGHVVQPTEPTHIAAEQFANIVRKETNGHVEIKIYPQGQLGGDRDMCEQIQRGALEMGVISAAPIAGFSPLVNALQLPWLVENHDKLEKIQKSDAVYEILGGLEDINLKVLAVYDYGFRHLITIKPVKNINDLAGMKLRVPESPMVIDMFKALGASPTPMAFGEIYTALQNKVIDGLEQDFSGIYSERFFEVAPYITLTRHFTWPALLVVNSEIWSSLPKEYQDIMIRAARESINTNYSEILRVEKEYTEELKNNGVTFINIDTEPFKEKVQVIYEKYGSDPAVKKLIEKIEDM